MHYQLFIVLLTAHMLADYTLQGAGLVERKHAGDHGALLLHVFTYWIVASVLSVFWMSWLWFGMIAIQTVLHWVLDYAKIKLVKRWKSFEFELELADLLLHVLVIWITINILNPGMNRELVFEQITAQYPSHLFYVVCIYAAALSFLFRGGTAMVRKLLGKVKSDTIDAEKDDHGRLIGNLERLFIFLIIIVANDLTAIGFVITAKSIVRFEEIKDSKKFAEYYLIGTLTSTIIAVLAGKAVVWMVLRVG